VAQHQANHARILRLRQTAENLDQQVKSTITLLADTRKELLDTPFASFPTDSRDVPFNELLQYAKNISKFTVPPTMRPSVDAIAGEQILEEAKPESVSPPMNGTMMEGAQPHEEEGTTQVESQRPEERGVAVASLTTEQRQWLDQMSSMPFVPWPMEDTVKAGALAAIHGMLDRGEDPGEAIAVEGQVAPTAESTGGNVMENVDEVEDTSRATQRPAKPQQAFVGFGLYNPDEDA
jgi:hypothetical protein